MALPLIGPGQMVAGVARNARVVRDTLTTTLGLLPRVGLLLSQVEAQLARLDAVVGRVEGLVGKVEGVALSAEQATGRANKVIDGADAAVNRSEAMLTQVEQPLDALLPSLRRFAETLDPAEVEAAVTLIDRLPTLLRHVEDDLLPMLVTLDRVGPDVHEILEVLEDLRRVLTGLPGMKLLRRRGDPEPAELDGTQSSQSRH